MTSERYCTFSRIGGLCCLMLTLSGCGSLPTFVLPNELFPEIEYLMANRSDFAQDPDQPLADVVAGEVFDSLDNLDGCWGAFDVFFIGDPESSESRSLDDFEFYEFDSATQYFEYQVLQDGDVAPFGRVIAVLSQRGTFEITDADRITATITAGTGNDPTTGDLMEIPFEVERVREAYVTVSGDRMKIKGFNADEGDDQGTQLVFRRFDCPN